MSSFALSCRKGVTDTRLETSPLNTPIMLPPWREKTVPIQTKTDTYRFKESRVTVSTTGDNGSSIGALPRLASSKGESVTGRAGTEVATWFSGSSRSDNIVKPERREIRFSPLPRSSDTNKQFSKLYSPRKSV